jgi:hypothetical protein
MPSQEYMEVYKQHRTAEDKYVYFLLAATGAAIAFAVNQTHDLKLSCTQVPLGVAVFLWALSFYCGCKHLTCVLMNVVANGDLVKVKDGDHPSTGSSTELKNIAIEGIQRAIEENGKWAGRYWRCQFSFLVYGAIFYLVWHIYEMWLRA